MSLVMQKLFVGRLFEYTSYILAFFTAGWTVSGIIVIAFQCRLPTPWDSLRTNECVDIVAFGNYLASTNIVIEVLLVLVPLAVWTQDSPVGNRLYVSAVFWFRLRFVHTPTFLLGTTLTFLVSLQQSARSCTSSTLPYLPFRLLIAGLLPFACKLLRPCPSSAHVCQACTLLLPKT